MPGQFSISIKKFVDKTGTQMDDVLKKVLFDISTKVVTMSPVGNRELWAINKPSMGLRTWRIQHGRPELTLKPEGYVGGRFRANWQIGEGTAPTGELFEKSPPASGYPSKDAVLGELQTKILSAKFGKTYWLVNNLPYAVALEYGHSHEQAPAGMVGITMVSAQAMVDKAVAEVKGGA